MIREETGIHGRRKFFRTYTEGRSFERIRKQEGKKWVPVNLLAGFGSRKVR